jgi:hypothetical protein
MENNTQLICTKNGLVSHFQTERLSESLRRFWSVVDMTEPRTSEGLLSVTQVKINSPRLLEAHHQAFIEAGFIFGSLS